MPFSFKAVLIDDIGKFIGEIRGIAVDSPSKVPGIITWKNRRFRAALDRFDRVFPIINYVEQVEVPEYPAGDGEVIPYA